VEAEYHANDVAKPPTRPIFLKTSLNFAVPEIGNKRGRRPALCADPIIPKPPTTTKGASTWTA
jgi:hypothetical protein